jgi:hypothetical protein
MDSTKDHFWRQLPPLENLSAVHSGASFQQAPSGWWLAVSDVVNSTQSISNGLYREVNLINASLIRALLNLAGFDNAPFLFGGDGMVLLLPGDLAPRAASVLLSARQLAEESFGLDLRVGLVSIQHILKRGKRVDLAKLRLSADYCQAIFAGGGVALAEDRLKSEPEHMLRELQALSDGQKPSFDGLECRWKKIPAAGEEVVSLIIKAIGESDAVNTDTYREVLQAIESIYGTLQQTAPIHPAKMHLSLGASLRGEVHVRSFGTHWLRRFAYSIWLRLVVFAGMVLMNGRLKAGGVNWGNYKIIAAANTDHWKFCDQIQQIVTGTQSQRQQLCQKLDQMHREQKLVYGKHIADGSFITCLISDYDRAHIHLVDGADGGYALAAQTMKRQLLRLKKATGSDT